MNAQRPLPILQFSEVDGPESPRNEHNQSVYVLDIVDFRHSEAIYNKSHRYSVASFPTSRSLSKKGDSYIATFLAKRGFRDGFSTPSASLPNRREKPEMSNEATTRRRTLASLAGALGFPMLLHASDRIAASQTSVPLGDARSTGLYPLDFPGRGPVCWIGRIFHFYTSANGQTQADIILPEKPTSIGMAQLLRKTAVRVTLAGFSPGAGMSFHPANQPTLVIPLLGSATAGLQDGSVHEIRPGDIAIAEDCTGMGHVSRAGPQGAFSAIVQFPKEGCPTSGSSDMQRFWFD